MLELNRRRQHSQRPRRQATLLLISAKNAVAFHYAEWGRTLYLRYCSKVGCLALNARLDFEAVIGESHNPRTFAR